MKLTIRIAAAKRRLRRMEEDRPFFLKRIDDFTEDEKAFAIRFFEDTVGEGKKELARLLAEREN